MFLDGRFCCSYRWLTRRVEHPWLTIKMQSPEKKIVVTVTIGERKEKDVPFARNQDIKIYYTVEGQGPPIILAHGITGNVTFWTGYGYVDQLKDKFTVIAFDARGHGQSDKPHEVESYDLKLMAGDVIAIMDALGVVQSHYWGYSMGGYIGFGIAKLFPDRLSSLVVGGATAIWFVKIIGPESVVKDLQARCTGRG